MGISIFPSTAAEFVSNNFVVDMNDTSNNTADTGGVKQAGPYSMSFSSGDSSFDVYLIDEDGNSVGYSNGTSITASGLFSSVVILGVAQDEIISFTYQGSVNNADGEGDEPGAGAYLESITPSDLPTIDDTATVTGGNFASDVEITFESGATVLPAKNIVRNSSTELVVTRPDGLVEDDAPYNLKAVNPGITPPTGSNAHILADGVTAGSDPVITTQTLPNPTLNVAYSETITATDEGTITDFSVTSGALPTGLSLNSSTGEISGTPTSAGGFIFTVTVSDDGGNTSSKEYEFGIVGATGGSVTITGGKVIHTFTSSGTFSPSTTLSGLEYVVVAGGGSGAGSSIPCGGGGAGGYRSSVIGESSGGGASAESTLTISTNQTVVVGAGAPSNSGNNPGDQGNSSSFGAITSIGGGAGGENNGGGDGGSGGGSGRDLAPGSGTAGQGFDGGDGDDSEGGGGGGAGGPGNDSGSSNGIGGIGLTTFITGSELKLAGGGGGDESNTSDGGGSDFGGGAAGGANSSPVDGTGGGGAGGSNFSGEGGADGIVIVRY